MDVSPCNSLLDLWFVTLVLSKTLNGSSIFERWKSAFIVLRPAQSWSAFLLYRKIHKKESVEHGVSGVESEGARFLRVSGSLS
jgi:hypothetical protein